MSAAPITEPGQVPLSKAEYEKDPCEVPSLRASIAWKLVAPGSTPAHAAFDHPRLNPNYKRTEKKYFDIGTAAHTLLFGRGATIKIIAAPDYKKKDAQQAKAAVYASGATPLLDHEWEQVQAMVKAAREQMQALVDAGTIERMPFQTENTEQAIFWREGSVMCRASLDGFDVQGDIVEEYKTTGESADPKVWHWQMRKLGYPFRLAFYRRGLEKLKISYSPEFRVYVQETKAPYLLSFVRLEDELIMRADEQVREAIKIWERCAKSGVWPGYSLSGYDLGLTDREKMQMQQQGGMNSGHVSSEDIAASL